MTFKELSESELGGESADANARPDNLMRWEGRRFEHFGCNHLATNYLVFNFKRYFCLSVLGKPQTNEAFLSRKSFVLANRGSPDLLWIYPDTNIEHAFLCFFCSNLCQMLTDFSNYDGHHIGKGHPACVCPHCQSENEKLLL